MNMFQIVTDIDVIEDPDQEIAVVQDHVTEGEILAKIHSRGP